MPFFVRIFESFGHLERDWQRFIERDRPERDALCERGAFHQFEDEGALFDTVDRPDIGMVQRSHDLRFAPEARQTVGIASKYARKDLDGHFAIQLRICRSPDFAHAAFAELGGDPVMGD
jgi:hypothetical protein